MDGAALARSDCILRCHAAFSTQPRAHGPVKSVGVATANACKIHHAKVKTCARGARASAIGAQDGRRPQTPRSASKNLGRAQRAQSGTCGPMRSTRAQITKRRALTPPSRPLRSLFSLSLSLPFRGRPTANRLTHPSGGATLNATPRAITPRSEERTSTDVRPQTIGLALQAMTAPKSTNSDPEQWTTYHLPPRWASPPQAWKTPRQKAFKPQTTHPTPHPPPRGGGCQARAPCRLSMRRIDVGAPD